MEAQWVTTTISADDRADWRPDGFGYNLLGCNIDFRFPTAKLLDFVGKEAELEASPNPFAVVVLAFLSARRTSGDDGQRRISKLRLIRSLYERGFERKDVEKLFRLIDWFMVLPAEMENEVWREVEQFEQEMQMRPLTPREMNWLKDGAAKARAEDRASWETAIETILELKFGPPTAATLMADVRALDSSQLPKSMNVIKSATSPDELRRSLMNPAESSEK